jgi:hypothetical protein
MESAESSGETNTAMHMPSAVRLLISSGRYHRAARSPEWRDPGQATH